MSAVSPGAVETDFTITRYRGDKEKADAKYKGYQPLVGEDVAESIYFIAAQSEHVNIEELILQPIAQASAFVWNKKL